VIWNKSDGEFLREIEGLEGYLEKHAQAEEMAVDEMHRDAVRHYFSTAPAAGTRASEKLE